MLLSDKEAATALTSRVPLSMDFHRLLSAGFTFTNEPFFHEMLVAIYRYSISQHLAKVGIINSETLAIVLLDHENQLNLQWKWMEIVTIKLSFRLNWKCPLRWVDRCSEYSTRRDSYSMDRLSIHRWSQSYSNLYRCSSSTRPVWEMHRINPSSIWVREFVCWWEVKKQYTHLIDETKKQWKIHIIFKLEAVIFAC